MARNYSKYEYETSPRKLEPYYAPKKAPLKSTKKTKATKAQKEVKKIKVKVVMYLIIIFALLFASGYRNAQIDENFEKVQTLKSELAAIEKENAQLEVAIESSLNLTNLEQQARNLLGMQKLSNKQTEYVTLPRTDYIEATSEQVIIEENKGILKNILEYVSQLFK